MTYLGRVKLSSPLGTRRFVFSITHVFFSWCRNVGRALSIFIKELYKSRNQSGKSNHLWYALKQCIHLQRKSGGMKGLFPFSSTVSNCKALRSNSYERLVVRHTTRQNKEQVPAVKYTTRQTIKQPTPRFCSETHHEAEHRTGLY